MRTLTLTSLAFLVGAGFAGSVAQAADMAVPAEKCNAAWTMASPGGDTIAKGAAVPVVLDFTMVDTNADGAIDKDEFNKACSAGLVKADEATVAKMK
jgi:hypothetical protein